MIDTESIPKITSPVFYLGDKLCIDLKQLNNEQIEELVNILTDISLREVKSVVRGKVKMALNKRVGGE